MTAPTLRHRPQCADCGRHTLRASGRCILCDRARADLTAPRPAHGLPRTGQWVLDPVTRVQRWQP